MKRPLQIAIDGPVAAGKGTISSIIARKLGILYVYTGAMYRAVAFLGQKNKIDLKDEKKLVALLKRSKIELRKPKRRNPYGYSIFLNGEEVTEKIRNPQVSWGSSVVATLPQVRKILVKKQQEIAKNKSVIMEGRDITTRVLPNADLKIYLTANQRERARRRKKQLEKEQEIKKSLKEVLEEIKKRDWQDTERETDPLTIVPDAWVLDTTHLTASQVVEKVLAELKERNLI